MNAAKPFVCPAIGCNQQFANEDHLEVHRRKHEMSLGLRDFKSLDTPVIADQTPTPTRFLKNCEEVGLFSELPNPFDAEFRRATTEQQKESESNNNESEEQGNTNNSSTSDNEIESSKKDIIEDSSEHITSVTVGDTSSTTTTASPPAVSSTTQEEEGMAVGSVAPQTINTPTVKPISIFKATERQQQQVQQQSVVVVSTAPTVVTQSAVEETVTPVAPAAPPPPAGETAPQVSASSVNMPFLNTIPISAPILLRLPNGQTIPVVPPSVANPAVQIPLAVSAVAEPQAGGGNVAAAAAAEPSNIKMKLKSALLTSQTQGNMGVMTQAVEVVTRQQQAVTSTSPQVKPETTATLSIPGRRRRNSDEDPDEKRKRFLERNRAAATRCRNKRKQWISNLEVKADELTNNNVRLQNEVTTLRNEVAQLKQLLLAHKDCPVTVMQRKAQVQILAGSGAADLQAVNTVSVANSQPEVMEVLSTSDVQHVQVNPAEQKTTIITVQAVSAAQESS